MTHTEKAERLFAQGYNCAQSVLGAFCEELGMPEAQAMKLSAGFGGGMRVGEACGALTGALMALGQMQEGTVAAKPASNAAARALVDSFRGIAGAVTCRDLLGYDLGTPEGAERMRHNNGHDPRCIEAVRAGVEAMEKMLA